MIFGIGVGSSDLRVRARAQVERGLFALATHPRLDFRARSELVEGPGQGTRAGAWFVNGACVVETALFPRDLLRLLHAIERGAGRLRTVRNAPRTLDLDLLWSPGLRLRDPELQVPHPRLMQRPFALLPLRQALARCGLERASLG